LVDQVNGAATPSTDVAALLIAGSALMKTRDELDEMLAVDVLSDPAVLDGLSPHQRQVAEAWLKQCNDRRGIPEWPHNKRDDDDRRGD
jgi:hypothetical protein